MQTEVKKASKLEIKKVTLRNLDESTLYAIEDTGETFHCVCHSTVSHTCPGHTCAHTCVHTCGATC